MNALLEKQFDEDHKNWTDCIRWFRWLIDWPICLHSPGHLLQLSLLRLLSNHAASWRIPLRIFVPKATISGVAEFGIQAVHVQDHSLRAQVLSPAPLSDNSALVIVLLEKRLDNSYDDSDG